MTEPVEIKAELRLEDLASEILKQIRGEVEETSDEVDAAKSTWADWAASAAQNLHNLGINVKDVALQVADFGKSFIDAAAGGESADTALGGLISAVQGIPFEEANERAKGLHDEIDEIAMSSGAMGNVEEAFHKLVDFTGATNEGLGRARGNISALSNVSGVLGKDVNAITQEFALMQEGTIRTKGQLFQLLQSTGAFGAESKKVAAEWGKLTDEKRAAILEGALDKIAGRLEGVPKTFNNWSTSLHNMGEIAKEQIGEPFMNALTPALEEAMAALVEMKPEILELAQVVGGEFKNLVTAATDEIRAGFVYMKEHKEDLKSFGETLRSAWSFAKTVASFIIEHKEEIALAFGAKLLGGGLGSAVALGGSVRSEFAALQAALQKLPENVNKTVGAMDVLKAGLNKSVGAVDTFTVALAVISAAIYKISSEWGHVIDEQADQARAPDQALEASFQGAIRGNVSKTESIYETQKNLAATKGEQFEGTTFEQQLKQHIRTAEIFQQSIKERSAKYGQVLGESSKAVGDALRASGQEHYTASGSYADKVLEASASKIVQAYNQAIASNDTASATYAINMLGSSRQLQEAFLASGATIDGGIQQMAAMLYDKSSWFAKTVSGMSGDKLAPGSGPTTNVFAGGTGSGSVNISVKQDFRNADPDRVAYAFQRDIKRAAENRYQAATVTPFG